MKSFTELGFNEGDTVVCTSTMDTFIYEVGDKFDLVKNRYGTVVTASSRLAGTLGTWKRVSEQ